MSGNRNPNHNAQQRNDRNESAEVNAYHSSSPTPQRAGNKLNTALKMQISKKQNKNTSN